MCVCDEKILKFVDKHNILFFLLGTYLYTSYLSITGYVSIKAKSGCVFASTVETKATEILCT